MPGWSWWVIWVSLSLGAAGYLAYLAFEIFNKSLRVFKEVEKTAEKFEKLATALESSANLPVFEGNLFDSPNLHAEAVHRNQKKREARRLAQQRRLITRNFSFQESEQKP